MGISLPAPSHSTGRVPEGMEGGDRDSLLVSRNEQQVPPVYSSALSARAIREGGPVPPPFSMSACPCTVLGRCFGDRERNFPRVFRSESEYRTLSRVNTFQTVEAWGFLAAHDAQSCSPILQALLSCSPIIISPGSHNPLLDMESPEATEFLRANPAINDIIGRIPKEGVHAIYLFGSHARGTARPYSDIDLCIVTDDGIAREQKEILHSFCSRKIHISLFQNLLPAVRIRVFKEGILLWGGETLTLHRLKAGTVRTFLGMQRLLRRHIQHVLGEEMYDTERIAHLIGDIDRYRHDLELLGIRTEEDMRERKNFYALSMVLFSLLTALIDLGEEVVLAHDLGTPTTDRDIFSLLESGGYIDRPLFLQMSQLVSYRNRFAHEYGEIAASDLVCILSSLEAIANFVGRAKELVKQETG